MNDLPKACVILGAGASHDVHGDGSTYIDKRYIPPLAIDLFNINKNSVYYDILRKYPGALYLAQTLARKAKSGQISLESELLKYSNHHDMQIREHFKHVPPYLRDLIYYSSESYTSTPSSYAELLMELLSENQHKLLFLVLNYDNLLEKALHLYNSREYSFLDTLHYIIPERQANVVKLHGSVNWFKRITSDSNIGWIDTIKNFDISKKVSANDIIVQDSVSEIRNRIGKYWAYPIITAPLASKSLNDIVCPDSQIKYVKEFLSDCRKFLIIGTSGLDSDLFDVLNSSVTKADKNYYQINIVGVDESAEQCKDRFRNSVQAFQGILYTQNVFRNGFREYIRDGSLSTFAKLK